MPRIEVIGPNPEDFPVPKDWHKERTGYGTRLLVDGREIGHVRDITVRVNLTDPITVTAELVASEQFHFEGDAALKVAIVTVPGCTLIEETRSDGTRTYRAERREELTA